MDTSIKVGLFNTALGDINPEMLKFQSSKNALSIYGTDKGKHNRTITCTLSQLLIIIRTYILLLPVAERLILVTMSIVVCNFIAIRHAYRNIKVLWYLSQIVIILLNCKWVLGLYASRSITV